MSSSSVQPRLDVPGEIPLETDDGVRKRVWSVLGGLYPQGRVSDGRSIQRFPYPQLLYLTPVNDNNCVCGEAVAVIGKHLSEAGLGFYHAHPLPYRRMIASLQMPHSHWAGFLVDIKWTRFTQFGWYDSGGKFLQAVDSPLLARVA